MSPALNVHNLMFIFYRAGKPDKWRGLPMWHGHLKTHSMNDETSCCLYPHGDYRVSGLNWQEAMMFKSHWETNMYYILVASVQRNRLTASVAAQYRNEIDKINTASLPNHLSHKLIMIYSSIANMKNVLNKQKIDLWTLQMPMPHIYGT